MIKSLTLMAANGKNVSFQIISLLVCCYMLVVYAYSENYAYAYDQVLEKEDESLESLAKYLTKDAKSDRAKVWSIYVWVTENIAYDVKGLQSGNYGDLSPNGVLKKRSAICAGYSGLFQNLAQLAGLLVVRISGYAKGAGYKNGQRFEKPNHDWNAVRIDNKWFLIDTTWGAGTVGNDKFNKNFEDHYFLTPPEQFIFGHLPEDKEWQLLKSPITKEEFESLPFLQPLYFKAGLKLKDNFSNVINATDSVTIKLEVPNNVKLMLSLDKDNKKLPDNLTFGQTDGNLYMVNAVFPSAGEYNLKIYTKFKYDNFAKFKKDNDLEEFDWAISYKIEASSGTKRNFPMTYNQFITNNVYLYTPLDGSISSSENQTFKLRVPGALKVAVITGNKWLYLHKEGDLFTGSFNLQRGEAKVFANFSEKEQYKALISYNVY
ncbi:MAG: hypothetical protein HQK93_08100 [Nitrospirae bacterium]|nr:hypothetical protein [Nitrospirota bacterium]